MKKQTLIALLMIGVVAAGCKKQWTPRDTEVITVDFKEAKESFDMSTILENDVEIIPLQTTKECIIGEIADIQIVDDEIFITDLLSRAFLQFGLSLKIVQRRGFLHHLNCSDAAA